METRTETRTPAFLGQAADVALMFGRLLMEAGAKAQNVERISEQVARGLGVEQSDVRVGYASLAITVQAGDDAITRVSKVGALGVNQTLVQALNVCAAEIRAGGFTPQSARERLDALVHETHHHPGWLVAIAVGAACVAFGRLLGVSWTSLVPIFSAATIAQLLRRQLAAKKVNGFLSTAIVAFTGALLCGLATRRVGTEMVLRDMVVAVLLLVPGVPAFNAQFDILEGRPTLGSARAVWVMVTLIFMALGVWIAAGILGEGR